MWLQFPILALAGNNTNAAIGGRILLPTTTKIYRVKASVSNSPAGTCSINIAAGTAAEGVVGTPDTSDNGANAYPIAVAPNGTILFATDQAISMTANDVVTQLDVPADGFDVVWNNLITLRTVTNGSGAGNLLVSLLVKFTDINPPQGSYGSITTGQPSVTGQGGFTPAIAIP